MNKSQKAYSLISDNRLITLLNPQSVEQCIQAYEILTPFGVVLEIACRSPHALNGIKGVVRKYPDALVLAGTVMTAKKAMGVIAAGVAGVVSADYIPEVVQVCADEDVMCIPGGISDVGKQLAQKAGIYGCELHELQERHPHQWIYKLFPAFAGSVSNVGFADAWRGPFKDLAVVYAGGITLQNIARLAEGDPRGIFCSSQLARNVADAGKMREDAEKWTAAVKGEKQAEKSYFIPQHFASKARRVVTFGELMLRLSPPDHQRFLQAKSFDAGFGGAEANAAVALANFGMESLFVTALPDNDLGKAAANNLRLYGVNTGQVRFGSGRLGVYFLEHGAAQRSSKVIYDRAASVVSQVKRGDFNWDLIFSGADWFHWSGITPALSAGAADVTLEALQAAKKQGLTVSVDLNYRSSLWESRKASEVMSRLMEYVDICIGNEEDAERIFGIKAESARIDSGVIDAESYRPVTQQLTERFGFKKAAFTLRKSRSASDNAWSGCLFNGDDFFVSREYDIHLVDRVGGGDAFSSGLIYALLSGKKDPEALEFAAAASCLAQTIPGDFNLVSVPEVEALLSNAGSGRIQR